MTEDRNNHTTPCLALIEIKQRLDNFETGNMRLTPATEEWARNIARQAAHEAIKETLRELGIKSTTDDDVINAQVDFAFLRRIRKSAESDWRHAKNVGIGLAVTAAIMGLWIALQSKLGGG